MSKGYSGHFKWTKGSTAETQDNITPTQTNNSEVKNSTAEVWNTITPTQPNYTGTELPRSFIIKTQKNSFWIHGNATEHMANYLVKQSQSGHGLESTKLSAQLILSDFRSSLSNVIQSGIKYNIPLKHGSWEFIIKPSKTNYEYDLIIHAMYKK